MKKNVLLLTTGVFIGLATCVWFFKSGRGKFLLPTPLAAAPEYQDRHYNITPGVVANVFGWGYNKSSCYLPSRKDTLQFFFAEDNHIYYGFGSDMSHYQRLDFPLAVNPDFDVNCLPDEVVAVSFGDLDQNMVIYGELSWKGDRLQWQDTRLVANGGSYRSAVAPQSRILGKTRFVSYMKFGFPGTDKMSKSMVAWSDIDKLGPFQENPWKQQELFSIKPELSQIMPVSIERYQDTMMAIIVHPDMSVYFSFFDPTKNDWSKAVKQDIHITGHLEWQTLATKEATYLVYRNSDQKMELARLSGEKLEVHTFENLGLNAMNLFQDDEGTVYVIYNDGLLRRLSPEVSKPIQIPFGNPMNFYFGQIAPVVGGNPYITWVVGKDGKYGLESQNFTLPSTNAWEKAEDALAVVKELKKE